MKRRVFTLLLTGILTAGMALPDLAYADTFTFFRQNKDTQIYAKMKAADIDSEADNAKHEKEVAETLQDPAYVATGAYGKQRFAALWESGRLRFSGMPSLQAEADEAGEGLLLKDTGEEFASGRITLADELNFDGNAVGRISIDGLTVRGTKASVEVYLDEDEKPAVTLKLGRQRKKGKWTGDGEQTVDVLEQNLKGRHKVSLRVVTDAKADTSVLLRSVEFAQSSLPVVYIDINEEDGTIAEMNNDPEHQTECYGSMHVQTPAGYTNEYTGKTAEKVQDTGELQMEYIRGRGNSTWTENKKPYKIKLEKKADLLGMGKNKHWVLLANVFDNSKMRNKMTYWLGDQLGLSYTPQCQFVEVVMNGRYLGGYYLCEHVRVGESRVEVDDLSDEKQPLDQNTITGGYLLSLDPDKEDPDKVRFRTKNGIDFLIESPEKGDWKNKTPYSDVQNYISDYVQDTEDAIYSDSHKNGKGETYGDLLDVDSAVRYHWVQEFSANGDAYISNSTYLYKKRGGKLFFGPLWDFDYVAWGDTDYPSGDGDAASTDSWSQNTAMWFGKLLQDPDFFNAMKAEWPVLKEKLQEITKDGGLLDQYYNQISISQKYDYEKWGHMDFSSQKPLTLRQEENRLKEWINNRAAWVDQNLDTMAPKIFTISYRLDEKTIKEIRVTEGETVGELPEAPERKGYVFAGWYGKAGKKTFRITEDSMPTENATVTGRYVKKKNAVPVSGIHFAKTGDCIFYYSYDDANDYRMTADVLPENATDIRLRWSSSDESVAKVGAGGTVHVLCPGTVTITAASENGIRASYKLTVVDPDRDVAEPTSVKLNRKKLTMTAGKYAGLTISVSPEMCYSPEYTYTAGNKKIAEVSETGLVKAKRPGKTVIVFYTPYMSPGVTIIPVTVKPAEFTVKKPAARKYTGRKIRPSVTVMDGKKKLKAGKEYTVSYKKNRKPGIAAISVRGKGMYEGTKKTVHFRIKNH